ncbi:hypothetical protein F5J12DRAFT_905692 [Pisolithus orientalis]|uniref:uncharacterized protein n=1 Tax=Pisolithus orientalis TaxID=936130 RepID=UPI00222467B3|nr:uncharacterized protein F5J12DRAFT_905692 [Pisolithus orientalis]KAI6006674.1 hypothetical protein F5J12DRAFT_905692 [Pisolithus orientalis]
MSAAFRNPSSPFHIPPGETGPASPDDPPPSCETNRFDLQQDTDPHGALPAERAEKAREALISMGCDADTLWEQSIGRMQWAMKLGDILGGRERVDAMLAGKGVSLILKSININFRKPVTFPDTLLVGHKAIVSSSRTQFLLNAVLYSYAQQKVVADAEGVIVWYDYDRLKKCDPGDVVWRALRDGMGAEYREGIGRPSRRLV